MEQQMQPIQQRSQQWRRVRLGKFTSSKFHLFAKGALTTGVKSYITELLFELKSGESSDMETYAMKYGTEWEPMAKKEVERRYKSEYFDDEFIQHPTLKYYGGSADGFITINGIDTTPEIKCPTGKEHFVNIKLLKDVETCKKEWPEIYGQCQSNMNLQGNKMALAVTFQHKAMDMMYKDLMLPRDEEYIKNGLANMAIAWEYMLEEAKLYNIDILAKYEEYSKPLVSGMQPLEDIDTTNIAA